MSTFPPPPVTTIDWSNPAAYKRPDCHGHIEVTYHKSTGQWTPPKFVADPYMRVHCLATGLNYGQQCFEGVKAFRGPGDSSIAILRPHRNAWRLQHSAEVLNMPKVPEDLFIKAVKAAIALNADYVPPHITGWAMYVRPLLFASGAQFPPGFPDEAKFIVLAFPSPEGSQYGVQAVKALILDEFDRAAPRGVGHAKVGGNYGPVLRWSDTARSQGYGLTLHLDSQKREIIDEFSLSGFLGVKRPSIQEGDGRGSDDFSDVTLIVPESRSAIVSLTSEAVQLIAKSWGWTVETRPLSYTELPELTEVMAAGTAVGLVPVRSITRRGHAKKLPAGQRVVADSDDSETVVYVPDTETDGGPVFFKLYTHFKALQLGKVKDELNMRSEITAADLDVEVEANGHNGTYTNGH